MSDLEPNPLVPEEELQAALAEIEQLSGNEAAAIPSLDDSDQSAPQAAGGTPAPQPQPPTPAAEDVSAPENAAAPVSETPDASAPEITEASFSEAEVDATLDELQTVAADIDGALPGSDTSEPADASENEAALEDDEGDPSKPLAGKPAGQDQPGKEASTKGAPPAEKDPASKLDETPGGEELAADRAPAEWAEGAALGGLARPATPLVKRVYRTADRAIDAVNRPFAWLGDTGRALVGWVALTTLIVSILATVLMPAILPHRDAITFLREKRAQLEAPRLEPSRPDASQPDEPSDSSP